MNLIQSKFSLKDYANYDEENRMVYLYEKKDCDYLLNEFYKKVVESIDNKVYLPIIRIADGEFQFLLGKDEFNLRKPKLILLKNLLGELYRKIFKINFEAKSRTYTSGVYESTDFINAKIKYAQCLNHISTHGILAIYTIIKPNFYTEHYLPKLWNFFESNNININVNNYVPFYFVYIILTNKKYADIYYGKKLHLITSFNDDRKKKIEETLYSLGVQSVSWTKISRDKSLYDSINIDEISHEIDIVFVGAGVGKVNIFNQLKSLSTLVIDAGYIFETWENKSLEHERDYCAPHL